MPKPNDQKKTEVVASPRNDRRQRRRFSAAEKARILGEADACTERGQLSELLRREGIYSSQLSAWRSQRDQGGLRGLENDKPGRKPPKDAKDRRIEQLERELAQVQKENRIQKGLLDLQQKAHEILGEALPGIQDTAHDDSSSSSSSARKKSR